MTRAFRTIIVPENTVETMRDIVRTVCSGASGMFTTPLSEDGSMPATHYISSGYIYEGLAQLLPLQTVVRDEDDNVTVENTSSGNSSEIVEICSTPDEEGNIPLEITQTKVTRALNSLQITEERPFVMLDRVNLKIARQEEEL